MSGKYGDLIQKARNTENQKTGKPENQKTRKLAGRKSKASDRQMSGSGDGTQNKDVSKQPIQPDVNLTIKVPKAWRQHWVSKAKGEGNTLTAVIIEALNQKYGLPE